MTFPCHTHRGVGSALATGSSRGWGPGPPGGSACKKQGFLCQGRAGAHVRCLGRAPGRMLKDTLWVWPWRKRGALSGSELRLGRPARWERGAVAWGGRARGVPSDRGAISEPHPFGCGFPASLAWAGVGQATRGQWAAERLEGGGGKRPKRSVGREVSTAGLLSASPSSGPGWKQ